MTPWTTSMTKKQVRAISQCLYGEQTREELDAFLAQSRAPNKPRVHFILKDSVASSSTAATEGVDTTHGTQNSRPAIEGRINSAGTTAAPVHLAVGNELVAEGSAVVSAQTASTRGPGVQAVNHHTCLVLSQKSDRHKHPFLKTFLSWHGSSRQTPSCP